MTQQKAFFPCGAVSYVLGMSAISLGNDPRRCPCLALRVCVVILKVLERSWRHRQRRTGDNWLCWTIMNDTAQTPLGWINKAAFHCPATSNASPAAPRRGLCSCKICKMWFCLTFKKELPINTYNPEFISHFFVRAEPFFETIYGVYFFL